MVKINSSNHAQESPSNTNEEYKLIQIEEWLGEHFQISCKLRLAKDNWGLYTEKMYEYEASYT